MPKSIERHCPEAKKVVILTDSGKKDTLPICSEEEKVVNGSPIHINCLMRFNNECQKVKFMNKF